MIPSLLLPSVTNHQHGMKILKRAQNFYHPVQQSYKTFADTERSKHSSDTIRIMNSYFQSNTLVPIGIFISQWKYRPNYIMVFA